MLCFLSVNLKAQKNHAMARFLDTNTIAFARLDLPSFEPQSTCDKFVALTEHNTRVRKAADSINRIVSISHARLVKDGATEVYAFFSLCDLVSGPFYVIPCDPQNAGKLTTTAKQIVEANSTLAVTQIPEGILIASEHTAQRLNTAFLPERKDASEILALATNTFDIVLAPSQDQFKVIRESIGPPFPQYAGKVFTESGITGDLLADGMQTVMISMNSSPLTVELKVKGISHAPAGQGERLNATAILAEKAKWVLGQLQEGTIPYWPRAQEFGELPKELKTAFKKTKVSGSGNKFSIYLDESKLLELANGMNIMFSEQVLDNLSIASQERSARTIVLALHNHEMALKTAFPARDIMDEEGNPLLSWRVKILPYMGDSETKLFEKFELDEPWDSDHNIKLLAEMPRVYQTDPALTAEGKTVWTIPTGEHFIGNCKSAREVLDGTSNTIMVLGTAPESAMNWTQPTDLEPDVSDLKRGIFSESQATLVIGRADGSTDSYPDSMAEGMLMALLTYAGGDIWPDDN